MPTIAVNGTELFYREFPPLSEAGESGVTAETIVFSHGYLMDHSMFKGQIDKLKKDYRCIAFEHRGHGQSHAAIDGYTMDNLVIDAIGLIEGLDLGSVHFVGMSTGGFVGMRIALRRPELLKSLVLMSTSAESEPQKALRKNNLLLAMFKIFGWWTVIGQVIPIMFYKSFVQDPKHKDTVDYWRNAVKNQDKKAMYAFGKAIFNRDNVLPQLHKLDLPTAVIVGEKDVLTRPVHSQRMAEKIPNAKLYTIPDAGHSAAIEKADEVAQAMLNFYGD